MGIALTAVHGLFNPLHDLLTWLMSPVQARSPVTPAPIAQTISVYATARGADSPKVAACSRRPHRPLRVVRVMDKDGPRSHGGGRMVISGRMADVCAELDRLAALEATRH